MITSRSLLISIVTVVIIGVVIGAFFLVGSPAKQRLARFDEQRAQNLQTLRYSGVDEYVRRNGALPNSIIDLGSVLIPNGIDTYRDPETNALPEYAKTSTETYSLCATFDLPSDPNIAPVSDVFWSHPAGRKCFDFKMQSTGPTSKSSVPL